MDGRKVLEPALHVPAWNLRYLELSNASLDLVVPDGDESIMKGY
jgi:hypothetical protein